VLSSTAAEAGSRGSALFKVKLGLKDVQNFIPGNRVNARSWLPFSTFQKKKKIPISFLPERTRIKPQVVSEQLSEPTITIWQCYSRLPHRA
jgi:hypothetical protein